MKKYLGFLIVVFLIAVMFAGCTTSTPGRIPPPTQTSLPVVAISNAGAGNNSVLEFRQEITDAGNYTTFRFIPLVNVTGPLTATYQMQEEGKAFISDRKFCDSVTSDNPVEIVVKRPDNFFSLSLVISDKEGQIIYNGGVGGGPGSGLGGREPDAGFLNNHTFIGPYRDGNIESEFQFSHKWL